MDNSGRIYELPEGIAEALKLDGADTDLLKKLHPLTDDERKALEPSAETQRLSLLEAIRKHPLTSVGDVSDDESRKIRNAAKRARRAWNGK